MSQACQHGHDDGPGLRGAALADELSAAALLCSQRDQRLTEPRRRVLELLLVEGQPMKAYDLMAAFGAAGQAAKPPTVYRALDFLEKQGLAHRIESLNAFVACRRGPVTHSAAFLICDCCGLTAEIEPATGQEVADLGARSGFQVQSLTIEAHGLCKACQV
jgi:Fur family zinc uptake transcriptional regulator